MNHLVGAVRVAGAIVFPPNWQAAVAWVDS